MSFQNFEVTDKETIDSSIITRNLLKRYHQQGASLNDPDQNFEFIFGENNKYCQNGIAYLPFDLTVCKADNTIYTYETIRSMNLPFAYTFREARLATTGEVTWNTIKI